MAVIILESLVQRGILVAGDEDSVQKRIGSDPALDQAPAFLSCARHPSPRYPQAGLQPGLRRFLAGSDGREPAANGAGRPGSRAGVLMGRSSARTAEQAVLLGWSFATAGSNATFRASTRGKSATRNS